MPSATSKRLYLKGLPRDVTQEDLSKQLCSYGQICEVKMLSNYAFVQFESEADALVVLETFKNQPLFGKYVVIEFAHPLRKDMPSISSSSSSPKPILSARRSSHSRYPVVVLDLPRDIGWQELKDFGRLSGMLVAYCDLDKTQPGRGFIDFFTREDAKRAVGILDGRRLGGRRVRVIDHEDMREPSTRVRRRNRSRSSSPRRPSISDRSGDSDHSWHSEIYTSAHQPRPFSRRRSEVEQSYDHHDHWYSPPRYPAHLPALRTEKEELYPYRASFGVESESADYLPHGSAASWPSESRRHHHHDYYQGHDYPERQYLDTEYGGPYGPSDPGYESRLRESHHFQRLMDPYQ